MPLIILLHFLQGEHISGTTMTETIVVLIITWALLCPSSGTRKLLMMDIVVPETCWAYKKYNKIISGF